MGDAPQAAASGSPISLVLPPTLQVGVPVTVEEIEELDAITAETIARELLALFVSDPVGEFRHGSMVIRRAARCKTPSQVRGGC